MRTDDMYKYISQFASFVLGFSFAINSHKPTCVSFIFLTHAVMLDVGLGSIGRLVRAILARVMPPLRDDYSCR